MAINRSVPSAFFPSGVTDTTDTAGPSGSMAALVNLIPDPSTDHQFVPRPAAEEMTDFTGFSSPGFVSAQHVRGPLIFGMIASATNPGRDEPFCYDADAAAFIPITGATAANTPLSPASTGEWEPPVIAPVGTYLLVTHPGFDGVTYFFGWIDISNLAAPTWDAGNTTTNPLPARPRSVAAFNARAYYAVDNDLVFSDVLLPLVVSAAANALVLGDSTEITALGSAQFNTQYGGVIAALIAFKGASVMYQVTGDKATNDLAQNSLDVATGTLAPNSLANSPKGLAFMSPQGLRIIDGGGNVTDPIGDVGSGVTIPFRYALESTRIAAAYNDNIYRVSVQNGKAIGTPWQEWWYHFTRGIWTGPHTFPASLIHAFTHPSSDGGHASFVMTPVGVEGALFDSHALPALDSVYVENGTQLTWEYTTSFLPDTLQMAESANVELTINMSLIPGVVDVEVLAYDEDGTVLSTATISPTGAATVWGAFTWGAAPWRGALNNLKPRQAKWSAGLVYRWLQISVTGESVADYQIGTMYYRLEVLKYLQQ